MKKGFWFQVRDVIKKTDIIIELLDARMPELTRIPQLEAAVKRHNKKLILVVHKFDLLSKDGQEKLKKRFSGSNIVHLSSKTSQGMRDLYRLIGEADIKFKQPRIAIIGYPNIGKSTLINKLSKKGRARTSSESGFTRGIQFIAGRNNTMLYDTPGVVPFAARDEVRLGLVAGISPDKLQDPYMVAYELVKLFQKTNPERLRERYDINPKLNPEDFLEELGQKYQMIQKKGMIDEIRVARKILNDWHKGKIKL